MVLTPNDGPISLYKNQFPYSLFIHHLHIVVHDYKCLAILSTYVFSWEHKWNCFFLIVCIILLGVPFRHLHEVSFCNENATSGKYWAFLIYSFNFLYTDSAKIKLGDYRESVMKQLVWLFMALELNSQYYTLYLFCWLNYI